MRERESRKDTKVDESQMLKMEMEMKMEMPSKASERRWRRRERERERFERENRSPRIYVLRIRGSQCFWRVENSGAAVTSRNDRELERVGNTTIKIISKN